MRRRVRRVVPPSLRGRVLRNGRDRGLHLHGLLPESSGGRGEPHRGGGGGGGRGGAAGASVRQRAVVLVGHCASLRHSSAAAAATASGGQLAPKQNHKN